MKEVELILKQLESTYAGDPWHGPSFKTVVRGITAEVASARVPGEAHTIWELVSHMQGWSDVVIRRLQSTPISEPVDGDFPEPPPPTAANWKATLKKFDATMEEMRQTVASLTPAALNRPVPGRQTPVTEMLHGIIWHNVYHTGQIAILKRAILSNKKRAKETR